MGQLSASLSNVKEANHTRNYTVSTSPERLSTLEQEPGLTVLARFLNSVGTSASFLYSGTGRYEG